MEFTAEQKRVMTAVIDRIIPKDEFPSASEAGVMHYLERQFRGDAALYAPDIADLFKMIDAAAYGKFGKSFLDLSDAQRDDILISVEGNSTFHRLMSMTQEGYYADPSNGGNLDGVAWKMIGFEPRDRGNWEGKR